MKKQQPKYALHKATGQARLRINGELCATDASVRWDACSSFRSCSTDSSSISSLTVLPLQHQSTSSQIQLRIH